jgi:hypothetical protein
VTTIENRPAICDAAPIRDRGGSLPAAPGTSTRSNGPAGGGGFVAAESAPLRAGAHFLKVSQNFYGDVPEGDRPRLAARLAAAGRQPCATLGAWGIMRLFVERRAGCHA